MPEETASRRFFEDAASEVRPDLSQSPWQSLIEATSTEELATSWLDLQSRMIGGVYGGVVLLESPETGSLLPAGFFPKGSRRHDYLAPVIERALNERKGVVLHHTRPVDSGDIRGSGVHLAYPVLVNESTQGVAAFHIRPRELKELQDAMRQLQWGIAWLQNWALRRSIDPEIEGRKRLTAVLEMAALALEQQRFKASATSFVTELATRMDCDRVSLGFKRRGHVKVLALSHSAQFEKQTNLIRSISQAMSEAMDQNELVRYPEPTEGAASVFHFHEMLARSHGDGAICTVPFSDPSGVVLGALTLERSSSLAFDQQSSEICDTLASFVGPILAEKKKNDRLLIAKACDSLWALTMRLFSPRHHVFKLAACGIVALLSFFCLANGTHRVRAKTVLEGEVQRAVVAPYRGFVFTAPVRAGDIVHEGQLLCSLDDRDLKLEQERLTSERDQYVHEHRKSMAEHEPATMKILSKKINQSEAQLALIQEQLDRTRIVAPFDGVVVKGDLSQSLGSPVEAGQLLFSVAPLESYRVVLKVDEHDISYLQVGQNGELSLTALPEKRLGLAVAKITPVSVSEDGKSYFKVEAKLSEVSDRLRPGMEGYAKVVAGRAKLIWIWTHDLIEWARLRLWAWLP